jgi:hypothetical protein
MTATTVSRRTSFDASFGVLELPPARANGDRSVGSSVSGGFGALSMIHDS